MELKRDLVKYVRDKAKSKYDKGTECFICGATENLDFHHFHGLTELLEIWLRKNKIKITGFVTPKIFLQIQKYFCYTLTYRFLRHIHD